MTQKKSQVFAGTTPDVTPAQIGAVLMFVCGQAVAWGWITDAKAQVLVSAGSVIIAAVWKLADAFLRGSRAKAKGSDL